ncbi:MAG: hypothetical protein QOJ71_1975, partial [Actinomycetota bacterium]|nr:hypothetical protein [Actinomycetota bacterium]
TPAADVTSVPHDTTHAAGFDRAVANGSTAFQVVDALNRSVSGAATLNAGGTVATFTPSAVLASETSYTVTVSGATSLGGAVMTAPVSWSFTTASRPTVTSVTPPANTTGVAVTTTVAAAFDQSVSGATVAVTDPAGSLVAGTTAYNAGTNTAVFTPAGPFNASTAYTATLTGATSRSGATMLPYTWSYATVGYGCPCTLMTPTATPANPAASDAKAVELGVRIKADVNGYISAVRFYKGTTNTGIHTGSLWTTAGTRLATVTFAGESASGWQQATFSTPVPVTAGTAYVVSYHTNVGRYSYTTGVFANGGALDNAPLHAPPASNGVFLYGANPAFPSSVSTTGVNYFVDAVFTTAGSPNVTATSPANSAAGIAVSQPVTARFDVPIQSAGLTFTLVDGSGANVAGTVALDAGSMLATLAPSAPLTPGVRYSATIRGKDTFGNQMIIPFGWSFMT